MTVRKSLGPKSTADSAVSKVPISRETGQATVSAIQAVVGGTAEAMERART